jgi:hypothetical protein
MITVRESTESWKTVLRDLKRRGMRAPVVAVGDSALGSGPPSATCGRRPARSGIGSTSLGTLPTSCLGGSSPRVKAALHEVMYAETQRAGARGDHQGRGRIRCEVPEGRHEAGAGCRRAAHVLRLLRRALEAPANIERDRVALRDGAPASAGHEGGRLTDEGPADGLQATRHGAGRWRRLDGAHLLPLVRAGIRFVDGVQPGKSARLARRAA